ncbi:hypothetical protein Efla_005434 [Eimeria flavescens]
MSVVLLTTEQTAVRVLDGLDSRARTAEAQVEALRQQMDEGRHLLEEAQGETAEGHRRRDKVTHEHAQVFSLTEKLRALETPFLIVQEANQLMKSKLDNLRMQQRLWHQEWCQYEETRLATEADAARISILEQQILDSKGHKEAVVQMNEAKARSEVAHIEASVRAETPRLKSVSPSKPLSTPHWGLHAICRMRMCYLENQTVSVASRIGKKMKGAFLAALSGTLCQVAMASDLGRASSLLFTALSEVQQKQNHANFVFSPYSILSAFHMAQLGAGGDTVNQMNTIVNPNETFKLPKFDRPARDGKEVIVVESANRVYGHKQLEEDLLFMIYGEEVKQAMDCEVEAVDFADAQDAARRINAFVHEHTHGHITQIVDASSLSDATKLVLVNALYFKAPWLTKFAAEQTTEGVFHALTANGREEQTVKFMSHTFKKGFMHYQENGMTAFSLNYADHRLRFYLYMPDDMQAFEQQLAKDPEMLEELASKVSHGRFLNHELHLRMPKFKLSAGANRFDLIGVFKKLGIDLMFDRYRADFSALAGREGLNVYVSQYVHQADIEVDEEGTEAAAATMMGMMLMSLRMVVKQLRVVVDKPFIFQVRFMGDGTNGPYVLFAGRVADVRAAQ